MMSSTTPLELDYIGYSSKSKTHDHETYSCLKTELSLSLPGSHESDNPLLLGLSLFDQQTQPAPNHLNGYSVINTVESSSQNRDFAGKRGFAAYNTSGKWGLYVNGGSECELGKGAALFSSHGVGGAKGVNMLEIGCKKPGQLKDMDIDVVASANYQKSSLEKKPYCAVTVPAPKAQVVGWPPIPSFRKNSVASASTKNSNEADGKPGLTSLYVKVSMDGAPYLRKVDLKLYKNYKEFSLALKKMFSGFPMGKDGLGDRHLNDTPQGSECVLTYEDKDGDWMLVGDVPWDMFTNTCKRLRIMKGSEAIRLGKSSTVSIYILNTDELN